MSAEQLPTGLKRRLRRLLRRDRIVLTRIPGDGPAIYAAVAKHGVKAGTRIVLKDPERETGRPEGRPE